MQLSMGRRQVDALDKSHLIQTMRIIMSDVAGGEDFNSPAQLFRCRHASLIVRS